MLNVVSASNNRQFIRRRLELNSLSVAYLFILYKAFAALPALKQNRNPLR